MKLINKLLGLLVGVYALFSAWGFTTIAMLREGRMPPVLPENMGSFMPVLMTLPQWHFLLWPTAVVLYFVAAWRLLTGRRGALIYTLALAIDLTFLVLLKRAGAVHAEPGAIDLDYVTAAITITLAVVLWLMERPLRSGRTKTTAQPAS